MHHFEWPCIILLNYITHIAPRYGLLREIKNKIPNIMSSTVGGGGGEVVQCYYYYYSVCEVWDIITIRVVGKHLFDNNDKFTLGGSSFVTPGSACNNVAGKCRDLGKPFERKSLTGRSYLRGPDKLADQNYIQHT